MANDIAATNTNAQSQSGLSFTPVMSSFQMLPLNSGMNTSTAVAVKFKNDTEAANYLDKQSKWNCANNGIAAGVNTVGMSLQFGLAYRAMDKQSEAINKYYDTQENIAGFQRDVAIEQLKVQSKAVEAQEEMHGNQCLHEEAMARIEGSTQARLAAISESGKTKRAEVLSLSNAFSRGSYNYGSVA